MFATVLAGEGCSTGPHTGPPHPPVEVSSELAWADWSSESFARARRENRIIVVNVVAVWCHWCHVMEEKTWADPGVAALVRERFVPIQVDSDARPDLAERYRPWGWPATVFLSPDAQPLLELRGYKPPREIAALLRELVADLDAGTLARREPPRPTTRPTDAGIAEIRDRVLAQLDAYYDTDRAGWGTRQKYPFPQPIEHAFFRARVRAETLWRDRALDTLTAQLALVDPVWGGMDQYSTRGDWNHPHHEKITAIQAGAILGYARAYRLTGDERWHATALAVAGYMLRFMHDPDGGFWTSQDADLRGHDADPVLGAEYYALDEAQRLSLGLPRIDTSVYADLNGMMIHALVELYAATLDPALLEVAERTASRILRTHRTPGGGYGHGPNEPSGLLHLRDQAAMGRALVSLYRATGERTYLEEAERIATFMRAELEDPDVGGFFAHTADPAAVGPLAQRRKPLEENGLAARFLIALHDHLDGDGSEPMPYREAARRALRAVGDSEGIRTEGRIVGTYLLALEELLQPGLDATVVGDPDDPRTTALHRAVLAWPEPRAALELDEPGGRYPDIGRPAVYLCAETACSSPITSTDRVAELGDAFVSSL